MAKPGMEEANGMQLTIGGVKVYFPCKPYPSQLSMMDKIVRGIDKQQNCLLESPTGSGKSLALLCSALAWQHAERKKIENEDNSKDSGDGCCKCKCDSMAAYDSVGSAGASSNTSRYFTATNQMPPPATAHDVPPGQSLLTSRQSVTSTDEDDDDDFKAPRTGLKTPKPSGSRGHVSIVYEDEFAADSKKGCCDCQNNNGPKRKLPKIYFGTRTHKQIAQITRELKSTAYKAVKMCILASREHTCVDPEVSKMSNKNEECKNKLDGPGCIYFDRVRRVTHNVMKTGPKHEMVDTAFDLEDFVQFCKKAHRACPYFVSRQIRETADIIFCPYNYLIDPLIRGSMEINLKGQIVILDEGHNIEDCARDSASFKVTEKELSAAIMDLQKMIDNNKKEMEHRVMRDLCQNVYDLIKRNESSVGGNNYDESSKVWTGLDLQAQLDHAKLTKENYDHYTKIFQALTADPANEQERQSADDTALTSTLKLLEGIFMVLDFMYRDEKKFIQDYRMALIRFMSYENIPTDNVWLGDGKGGGRNSKRKGHQRQAWMYSLNFWCMNPAVAFSDIGSSARSVVLTSGTLSPMDSFQSELGIPFPIQLEAAHVVGRSQVWVGTISKGPRGGSLLGTYQNASTYGYQDEVGNLVYQVCQTIPHGVLCFLSSYAKMEQLAQRWKDIGLWQQISQHKVILMEPRAADKADFERLMRHFYEVIRDTENKENSEGGLTGALFMAVVRGKVSEGLDFANNNARAVVTVGIPFPSVKDTQVHLKKKYNDEHAAKRGLLTGSEWYEIQAFRALNQALGRCIRHKFDWGALILLDERFANNPNKYIKGLSKWVRQRVQYYGSFQQAQMSLREYTKTRIAEDVTNATMNASLCTTVCDTTADVTALTDITDGSVTPNCHKPMMIGFKTPGSHRAEADASPYGATLDERNESRGRGSRNRRRDGKQQKGKIPDFVQEKIDKQKNKARLRSFFTPPQPARTACQDSSTAGMESPVLPAKEKVRPKDYEMNEAPVISNQMLDNRKGLGEAPQVGTNPVTGTVGGGGVIANQNCTNKPELAPRYMALSQAGGFLPDSQMSETLRLDKTQAKQQPTAGHAGFTTASQITPNKCVAQDTTVISGSLDIENEMNMEMECVDLDPAEFEFSPPSASTQMSNKKKKNMRSPLLFTSSQADHSIDFNPPLASTQAPAESGFKSARVTYEKQSVITPRVDGYQARSVSGRCSPMTYQSDVVAGTPEVVTSASNVQTGVIKRLSAYAFQKKPAVNKSVDNKNFSNDAADDDLKNKSVFKFVNLAEPTASGAHDQPCVIPDSRSNSPIMFDSDPLDIPTQYFNNVVRELQGELDEKAAGDTEVADPLQTRIKLEEVSEQNNKNAAQSVTKTPGRRPLFREKCSTSPKMTEKSETISSETTMNDSTLNVSSKRRNNRLSRKSLTRQKSLESIEKSQCIKEEAKETTCPVEQASISITTIKDEEDIFLHDEGDVLNSKRTPRRRKRQRSTSLRQTTAAKKVKGVVFTDSEEKSLVCSNCGQQVLKTGKYRDVQLCIPNFLSTVKSSDMKPECYVINRRDISARCRTVQMLFGKAVLNAYWSEAEKCCVEYLQCVGCHTAPAGDGDSEAGRSILGAHVIHCTDTGESCKYRAGQVWIQSDMLR